MPPLAFLLPVTFTLGIGYASALPSILIETESGAKAWSWGTGVEGDTVVACHGFRFDSVYEIANQKRGRRNGRKPSNLPADSKEDSLR